MEKNTAQIVAQARALRSLCGELAHGAAREAFIARVDDDIATLNAERVRVAIVALDGARDAPTKGLLRDLAGGDLPDAALVLLADRPSRTAAGAHVAHAGLANAASAAGIDRVCVLLDARRVFASPVLLGRVIEACDLVLLAGAGTTVDDATIAGIRRLAEAGRHAVRIGAPDPDTLAPRLEGVFRETRPYVRESSDADGIAALARLLPTEPRAGIVCDGSAARLALCAELLNKHVQAEVALLKFRVADVARLRRGEDAQEAGGDPREQAEMLKKTLTAWSAGCKEDLARMAEQGVLPFDPRLLANKLTIQDLIHREQRAAAVVKYPILGSRVFHPLVTHQYAVLPDPAALERIRQNLVTSLGAQVQKDADTLNHRAQELLARLGAHAALYPLYAPALARVRLPTFAPAVLERSISGINLESEAEDKFTRIGFFKRLMEGRMVASMAFSFLTMSAGVFVLFGEPNIKRGLMKFSGVIVIMMVLYFIFSMMVKGEEEHQELDELLERIRQRINQDVMRPLAKAQATILKAYGEFVEEAAGCVMEAVESVARGKAAERTRLAEQRKAEDESLKVFFARRQAAAAAAGTKVSAFVTALERARTATVPAASATGVRLASTAIAPAAAAGTAERPAAAATSSLADQAAAARAAAAERIAAITAQAKPMTASERLALLKSRPNGGAATAAPAPAATTPAATTPATTTPAATTPAATTPSIAPAAAAAPAVVSTPPVPPAPAAASPPVPPAVPAIAPAPAAAPADVPAAD